MYFNFGNMGPISELIDKDKLQTSRGKMIVYKIKGSSR